MKIPISKILFILSMFFVLLASCRAKRNLVYMSDIKDSSFVEEVIFNKNKIKIQEGDRLAISVNTESQASTALFNKNEAVLPNTSALAVRTGVRFGSNAGNGADLAAIGYQVDENGQINFPQLGKIYVKGLTLEEITTLLTGKVGQFTQKPPIINVALMNFIITVNGEVNMPGSFNVTSDKINVFQAIGMAGDMTLWGKRENVMLIREVDGKRIIANLNLNKKDITTSPYFYLQQNDILYVQPDNIEKSAQATVKQTRDIATVTSIVSAAALLLTVILQLIQIKK